MRHILGALSVCVFSVAIAAGAGAQQSPTAKPGGPQGGVQGFEFQQLRPEPAPPPAPGTRPLFYFFGVPVVVNAPVMPPYCNCATQTYAGAPAGGRNTPLVPSLMDGTTHPPP
jgi:hypothetical protein